jgi:hypothetical protein
LNLNFFVLTNNKRLTSINLYLLGSKLTTCCKCWKEKHVVPTPLSGIRVGRRKLGSKLQTSYFISKKYIIIHCSLLHPRMESRGISDISLRTWPKFLSRAPPCFENYYCFLSCCFYHNHRHNSIKQSHFPLSVLMYA